MEDELALVLLQNRQRNGHGKTQALDHTELGWELKERAPLSRKTMKETNRRITVSRCLTEVSVFCLLY